MNTTDIINILSFCLSISVLTVIFLCWLLSKSNRKRGQYRSAIIYALRDAESIAYKDNNNKDNEKKASGIIYMLEYYLDPL